MKTNYTFAAQTLANLEKNDDRLVLEIPRDEALRLIARLANGLLVPEIETLTVTLRGTLTEIDEKN